MRLLRVVVRHLSGIQAIQIWSGQIDSPSSILLKSELEAVSFLFLRQ